MIVEGILNVIRVALEFIFGLLPNIDMIQLPVGFMEWFTNILKASAYFLPLADFMIMLGIWFAVTNFQIIWKIITRIWDSIPFT